MSNERNEESLPDLVMRHGFDLVIVGKDVDMSSTEMVELIQNREITVIQQGNVWRKRQRSHLQGKGPRNRWGGAK